MTSSRFPPYEYFRKILKQNAVLKKRIAVLEKELKGLRSRKVVALDVVEDLSHFLNVKARMTSDELKLAIFKQIIDENVRIRQGE